MTLYILENIRNSRSQHPFFPHLTDYSFTQVLILPRNLRTFRAPRIPDNYITHIYWEGANFVPNMVEMTQ